MQISCDFNFPLSIFNSQLFYPRESAAENYLSGVGVGSVIGIGFEPRKSGV